MIERNERNNVNITQELTEAQLEHIGALYEIAIESTDANSVRRAVQSLLSTPGGAAYLTMHGLLV